MNWLELSLIFFGALIYVPLMVYQISWGWHSGRYSADIARDKKWRAEMKKPLVGHGSDAQGSSLRGL